MSIESTLWVEKWRPKTVEEVILPKKYKNMFTKFKETGDFPNLLLSGDSGIGKTTIAKALANDLGWSCRLFNASDMKAENFANDLKDFVTTRSLTSDSDIKIVILDEACGLKPDIQNKMKFFMEEHSNVCRFIMTANTPGKIIKPMRKRATEISFYWNPEELKDIKKQFAMRCVKILKAEEISFEKEALAELVNAHFPDLRSIVQDLHKYSVINGSIDIGVLSLNESSFEEFYKALKDKNFRACKEWIVNNKSLGDLLFTSLNNEGIERAENSSIPKLVHIVSEYAYRHAFVVDPEVNLSGMTVEILRNVQWK